ncbi:MAG: hypothetical protein AAF623_17285, partial [Planctomycetota bacterium]
FPLNQRWSQNLPGADRIWTPSIYSGLLVFVIAASGFSLRRSCRKRVYLTWVSLFFCVASFGWYGSVWIVYECFPGVAERWKLGPQVGGLYWLMNLLLPKYDSFRYPAKLFLVGNLGLCLLSALQWRRMLTRRWSLWLIGIILTSVIFLIGLAAGIIALPANGPPDPLFGPFDLAGSESQVRYSLVHTIVIAGLFLFIFQVMGIARKRGSSNKWLTLFCVFTVSLTGLELCYSNAWLVPQISTAVERRADSFAVLDNENFEGENLEGGKSLIRATVFRDPGTRFLPDSFQSVSSMNRIEEVWDWQARTLYPKTHLGKGIRVVGSFSSIWPYWNQKNLEWIRYQFSLDPQDTEWNAGQIIGYELKKSDGDGVTVKRIDSADLTRANRLAIWSDPSPDESSESNSIKLIDQNYNQFELTVTTGAKRKLAFLIFPDPGWKTYFRHAGDSEWATLAMLPDYYLSRDPNLTEPFFQIEIPEAGQFEILVKYEPFAFFVGMGVSLVSWGIVIFFGLRQVQIGLRRRRSTGIPTSIEKQ